MRNGRELYRHQFYQPVELDLRALWIDDEMKPGFNLYTYKLLNLSGSGMQFESNLELPIGKKINIQFMLKLDADHLLKGQIVRREKINSELYTYAVKFNIRTSDQLSLIRSINQLQLKKQQLLKKEKSS